MGSGSRILCQTSVAVVIHFSISEIIYYAWTNPVPISFTARTFDVRVFSTCVQLFFRNINHADDRASADETVYMICNLPNKTKWKVTRITRIYACWRSVLIVNDVDRILFGRKGGRGSYGNLMWRYILYDKNILHFLTLELCFKYIVFFLKKKCIINCEIIYI